MFLEKEETFNSLSILQNETMKERVKDLKSKKRKVDKYMKNLKLKS